MYYFFTFIFSIIICLLFKQQHKSWSYGSFLLLHIIFDFKAKIKHYMWNTILSVVRGKIIYFLNYNNFRLFRVLFFFIKEKHCGNWKITPLTYLPTKTNFPSESSLPENSYSKTCNRKNNIVVKSLCSESKIQNYCP